MHDLIACFMLAPQFPSFPKIKYEIGINISKEKINHNSSTITNLYFYKNLISKIVKRNIKVIFFSE